MLKVRFSFPHLSPLTYIVFKGETRLDYIDAALKDILATHGALPGSTSNDLSHPNLTEHVFLHAVMHASSEEMIAQSSLIRDTLDKAVTRTSFDRQLEEVRPGLMYAHWTALIISSHVPQASSTCI
jgi:hypothetical protein